MKAVAIIPTRYAPTRLRKLLDAIVGEVDVLPLDNGHEPPLADAFDTRGLTIYQQWNLGVQMARDAGYEAIVMLNDDAMPAKGVLSALVEALEDPAVGIAYPGSETVTDPNGPYQMTGFCFAFRADLPVPPFDEGFEWWCGDTAFERAVLRAGYSVKGVPGEVRHQSDSERNDWARRPELKQAAERDVERWRSMTTRTVLLVPRRANAERDKLWAWCKARWERYFPDIPIYEGYHEEGPFNRSAAVNTAARLADVEGRWDFGIVIDADIFIRASQVRAAIARASETGRVTWAHRRWRGVRQDWTKRIVADMRDFGAEVDDTDMDVLVDTTNPISWSCCVVIPRGVWDQLGGFDERFQGWGFEDMAFQSAVVGLFGHERIEIRPGDEQYPEALQRRADVFHLWHDRVFGAGRADKKGNSYTAEAITNARLGRRYMVAVRRDFGLTDRADDSDAEELLRDIGNLKRDDAALDKEARRWNLPDWQDWWPTLEELVAGAKLYRTEQSRSVTVVVHSGGSLEAWPDRSQYLRQALASLVRHVSGPIVQRVIYSDWGSALLPDLEAIAKEFGFYVVGPANNAGYTDSMRLMWQYLGKKAKGEFVFQAEDDFLYDRDVDLSKLIETLSDNPHLTQIALLRDAFYQDERETGGILGWPEPAFTQKGSNGTRWLEHRLFWTANPSLFRRSLTRVPWPTGKHSETLFGKRLFNDPLAHSAFWGSGEEWVKHIGRVRAGSGY